MRTLKVEKGEAPSITDSERPLSNNSRKSKGLCKRFRCRNFRQKLRAHCETSELKPRKQFQNK